MADYRLKARKYLLKNDKEYIMLEIINLEQEIPEADEDMKQ